MHPSRRPGQLEERLIAFAVAVWHGTRRLSPDCAQGHLVEQLLRAATSTAANYAEARAAESRRDFVHKMQICLKELRETRVWLELLLRLDGSRGVPALVRECDELTAIFVSSIKTARCSARRRRY